MLPHTRKVNAASRGLIQLATGSNPEYSALSLLSISSINESEIFKSILITLHHFITCTSKQLLQTHTLTYKVSSLFTLSTLSTLFNILTHRPLLSCTEWNYTSYSLPSLPSSWPSLSSLHKVKLVSREENFRLSRNSVWPLFSSRERRSSCCQFLFLFHSRCREYCCVIQRDQCLTSSLSLSVPQNRSTSARPRANRRRWASCSRQASCIPRRWASLLTWAIIRWSIIRWTIIRWSIIRCWIIQRWIIRCRWIIRWTISSILPTILNYKYYF